MQYAGRNTDVGPSGKIFLLKFRRLSKMSDETLRMWMSDLSDRIEQMGKSIRKEFSDIRSLLHSTENCPTKQIAETCSKKIQKLEKKLDKREEIKAWDVFKEILKSTLTIAGAVTISWVLLRLGLG